MFCPYCKYRETKVIDSRLSQEGMAIRRRRECLKCKRRFTTYEKLEEMPLMVVKKDGRREPFERNKLLAGIMKAVEKRPIEAEKIEEILEKIEMSLQRIAKNNEVSSREIGEMVMKHLRALDQVAYVRFASVYREFKDVHQFMLELKELLNKEKGKR
ncbi:MAG: transcriptional regulator NrdR [Candidatus Omnitrophica bacterium]|nr:transcriptional regulator NrdR [Candidatus Omnitrophota bacterium]MCM8797852.1 transcriptional regulator NrdR [Candidatus Omnitrophota bacterium]